VRFEIGSVADAEAALRYFNGFHDGFIRELTLTSQDRFRARGVHEMSGRLDLLIRFAHYNYREGEPPADQVVEARFLEVRDLVADFPLRHDEWAIMGLDIEGVTQSRLRARLHLDRLVDGEWRSCEGLSFTFHRAELHEVEP
jgi:hypothetical protein